MSRAGPDLSLQGILRFDSQGRCLFLSEPVCKITGYTRDQLLGDGWRRRISPEIADDIGRTWSELRAGRSVVAIYHLARSDGLELSVQLESWPEFDPDGRVVSTITTLVDLGSQEGSPVAEESRHVPAPGTPEELESLYRGAPLGLCVVNRDLRYVRANETYARLVGRSCDHLVGRPMTEVLPEPARSGALAIARRVFETGEPSFDHELYLHPGDPARKECWLLHAHPVPGEGVVDGVLAIFQDLSAVRCAERVAREHLAELESVFRNAPVGLACVDRELRYLRVNQVLADLNGCSIEEIVGRSYRDLSPETADWAEPFLRGLMERGESVRNLEVRSRPPADPDVEHVFLLNLDPMRDEAGKLIGHVSAVQDVTELRRTQREAALRLAELETLYAHAPVGICYSGVDLHVRHLNPRFALLCKRPVEECAGSSLEELLHDQIQQQILPSIRHAALSGEPAVSVSVTGLLPDESDRPRTWVADAHPVRSRNGDLSGVITVLQDATELAEQQDEIRRARDRLIKAQRIARLGSWEWNLVEDRFWWSDELYEIFGERRSGFVPSFESIFERVYPRDRARVRQQVDATLRDGRPYRSMFRILRPDGSLRVLFAATWIERTDDGRPRRLAGTCQDLTDLGVSVSGAAPG